MFSKITKCISIICLLFVLLACTHRLATNEIASKNLPGQTAPNDMYFVEGNENIPSFYISKIEEPNINYLIYLLWTNSIFGESYPEVVKAALPQQTDTTLNFNYNDPYVQSYLTHPAYAYYPVTNLSWAQIDQYLSWKTDRLNESILIKTGILNFNPEQKDEDNFNTDAYLCGQYQGDVRRNLPSLSGGERPVLLNDNVLFTGFRLPTAQEWDYLSQQDFTNSKKRKIKSNHIFGKDYYTLKWGRILGKGQSSYHGSNDFLPIGMRNYPINNIDLSEDREETTHLKDALSKNQVVNIKGGVREWVIDEYKENTSNTKSHWTEVMKNSGIPINNGLVDENGRFVEKDSLGKMNNFRFVDFDKNGKAYQVARYTNVLIHIQEKIKRLQREKRSHERRLKNSPIEEEFSQLKMETSKKQIELQIDRLKKQLKSIEIHPDEDNYSYNSRLNTIRNDIYKLEYQYKEVEKYQDREASKKRVKEINETLITAKKELKKPKARIRIIKGGTNQTPGDEVNYLLETESAPDVGFRCILPYTGAPVNKSLKVKWGERPMKWKF